MGWQIVQQPNRLFAIWSSVVDDFITVDATPEEIIEEMVAESRETITKKVQYVVGDLERGGKPYYQFTKTFDECVSNIRDLHGDDAESLKLLGLKTER